MQFQVQNIAVDFSFQNSEFIRLFTRTKYFELVVDFNVNDAPFPQIFSGTGYVTDSHGVALDSQATLQISVGTNGANQVNTVCAGAFDGFRTLELRNSARICNVPR